MVDARYRNKKNGRVAVVVQEDQKYRTVLIRYEDTEEEQQVSSSTLKRWWEELDDDDEALDDVDVEDDVDDDEYDDDEEEYEDDEDEDVEDDEEDEDEEDEDPEEDAEDDTEEDPEEVEDDDVAGDGTPLKEVGKEIAAQAKKKAAAAKLPKEKKSPRKLEINPEVDSIFEFIQQAADEVQAEAYVRDAQPSLYNYRVPSMKSVAFLVYKSRNRVELHCKAKQLDEKLAYKLEKLNHVFDRRLVITSLTADAKKTISSIIKTYAQEPATKKTGKKGKEAK